MDRTKAKLAEVRRLRAALLLDLQTMSSAHPGYQTRRRLLEAYTATLAALMAMPARGKDS